MALAFYKEDLTEEFKNQVRRNLYIQPKPSFVQRKFGAANTENWNWYLDLPNELRVPFAIGYIYQKQYPNLKRIPRPKHARIQTTFTGTLRPHQIPIVKEALDHLLKLRTTTLGIPTGQGKSIMAAYLACKMKYLTAIFVPRESLMDQIADTFTSCTNARVWRVGKDFPDECDVIVCMNTRSHLIPKEIKDQVGLLIIDEAHLFCIATAAECLLTFTPSYIIAQTATLEKRNDLHVMIYALVGKHMVFRVSEKPFWYYKCVTGCIPERKLNKAGVTDSSVYVKSLYNNDKRNKMILDLAKNYGEVPASAGNPGKPGKNVLIVTSERAHVDKLLRLFKEDGVECSGFCGTQKTYELNKVLIGTWQKLGVGFDQQSFHKGSDPFEVLIFACSFRDVACLVQVLGRIFRTEEPVVINMVDDDKLSEEHWKIAEKTYRVRKGIFGGEVGDKCGDWSDDE